MSSSQWKGAIHNNFVVRDKEYMQLDTPFSPSTNHVKQYTQKVETSTFRSPIYDEEF